MSTQKTAAIHTLGCKLNFSESSTLARQLEEAGYRIGSPKEYADVYIINTCSVTEFADKKCRQFIRRALRQNEQGLIVVTGCYAQLKPEELSSIPGVDLVLGAAEKFRLLEHLNAIVEVSSKTMIRRSGMQEVEIFEEAYSYGSRTRSFLKVQDGCDYKCSFCTIPQARGHSRSNSIDRIVKQAIEISNLGVKEIVITGVNVGDFQHNEHRLIDLLRALSRVKHIARFRISSIEPNLCSNEIIHFVSDNEQFMPHFHMPLQSGSNTLLKSMRRRYTRELYVDRVSLIKSLMPEACIGADVIVGFPGETEALFEESFDFIRDLEVDYLHVFTYSERTATHAEDLAAKVPMQVRRHRSERLRKLGKEKNRVFTQKHMGSIREVLIEGEMGQNGSVGLTDNYIKVELGGEYLPVNSIQSLKLLGRAAEGKVQAGMVAELYRT